MSSNSEIFTLSKGVLTVSSDIDREDQNPPLILNGECQAVFELTVELSDNIGGDSTETLSNQYTVSTIQYCLLMLLDVHCFVGDYLC